MPNVEIDFEVYKALTMRRRSEEHSYNDVLRELLELPESPTGATAGSRRAAGEGDWVSKGIVFPDGTEFRANYKGRFHHGKVQAGKLQVEGKSTSSPSDAARIVTGNSVNGWTFWECRFPGETRWRHINSLRGSE